MPIYVIAGVTGRVGSIAAEYLLTRGARIRAIVRRAEQGSVWSERGAVVAVGALEDDSFLTSALRDAAGFFVLLPENPSAPDFHGARREMADSIAAAVNITRVAHVVMLSATAAYLPDGNGPAKGLYHLEQALRATGTTLTAIRSCYLQENISSILPAATGAGIFPNFMPSADFAVPMIATKDVGYFAADTLLNPPEHSEVIDLLGPAYSMRQLAEKLGAALGKPLRVVDIPAADHVPALLEAGASRQFAEAVAELYAAFAAGRITTKGDRIVTRTTTIDATLASLLTRIR